MKKIASFAVALAVLVPAASFAASMSFAPVSGSYRPGQTFSIQVFVDPQGSSLYTVKAQVMYPADTLEVTSFAFANSWLPLTQSGYDLTDNGQGVLVKTGGYPGGLSTPQALGTITLRVKKVGSAAISFGSESLALDKSNANALTSSSRASFSFAEPEQVQEPVVTETEQRVLARQPQPGATERGVAEEPSAAEEVAVALVEPPLGPTGLALVSAIAWLNPVALLVIAALVLVSILFLKERHGNRKIQLAERDDQ